MTCRHKPGDPDCDTTKREQGLGEYAPGYKRPSSSTSDTPDAKNYEIVDSVVVGPHLVLRVKYPNCSKCSYEGVKVLVYLNLSPLQAMKWKTIDPHFRAPGRILPTEAPGPSARFPASPEGWADALAYANMRSGRTPTVLDDGPFDDAPLRGR